VNLNLLPKGSNVSNFVIGQGNNQHMMQNGGYFVNNNQNMLPNNSQNKNPHDYN
jgi:hypothetical protein